jgi:hypothetical protein
MNDLVSEADYSSGMNNGEFAVSLNYPVDGLTDYFQVAFDRSFNRIFDLYASRFFGYSLK